MTVSLQMPSGGRSATRPTRPHPTSQNGSVATRQIAALVKENFGVDVDASKIKPVRRNAFINETRVRKFLLETAKVQRPFNKFSRVSQDTLDSINAQVRQLLLHVLHRTPSKGKTI